MAEMVSAVEGWISSNILLYVLVGLGLYYGLRTRFVQVRHFFTSWGLLAGSRANKGESLSSFQAFTIGLASRVGTGNIAGVALALIAGGPGALMWMWLVALLGMGTSFMESTLAQIFKVRWSDRIYRGGPAYYMMRGLRAKWAGVIFALMLVFSYGIVFPMVQSNTIAVQLEDSTGIPGWATALLLMAISVPIILKGIRVAAKVTELIVPVMALIYLVIAVVIILINFQRLPEVLTQIFQGAFGLQPALAGTAGGVWAAITTGAQRGLFSNEAGQGSMPNSAATADVAHPVEQGLIQSIGTFVDTILVCSATGFMILLSGSAVYVPGREFDDGILTQKALTYQLDFGTGWTIVFMTFIIFLFCYSSVVGYKVFAELNIDFLNGKRWSVLGFRVMMVLAVGVGSVVELELAWSLADLSLALMTIMNLTAVTLLARYAFLALRDYERQKKAGVARPVFISRQAYAGQVSRISGRPLEVPESVWEEGEMAKFLPARES